EEIGGEIDAAVWPARQVHQVERRHAEQLAGALRIRRRDDRRVHPEEAALVEEAVRRLRERMPHASDRTDDVGARTQVCDLAQEFERVGFRLDRILIGIVDTADETDRARLHLEWL